MRLTSYIVVISMLVAQPSLAKLPTEHLNVDGIARQRFGNDAPWYLSRIPFFEADDKRIEAVYYYRWMLFRAHQRDLGDRGYISTEFLNDVSWQLEPWGSLNDATGFHLAEGRWLNDRRPSDDYIRFMYTGGNDRHFTDYLARSAWERYLVDGDRAAAVANLPAMKSLYAAWDDHFDREKGLYWVEPLLDATEYTISSIDASGGFDGFFGGDAFRPSVNAYMYANARAIAHLSRLAGQSAIGAEFDARANTLATRVHDALWNGKLNHFTDRYKVNNASVRYWEPIQGRELVGYLPWTFDMARDDQKFALAWSHLLSPQELGGSAGMRTVEPSYPYYMHQYRYDGGGYAGGRRECQWNGPAWPFQTAQVLIGMANLLDHYHQQKVVTRSDFMRLLRQYTMLHYQGDRLDLEENYEPDSGLPIVGLARSHHYFHSSYIDLILTGMVGIRPRADDMLEVNPLLPAANDSQAVSWFRMQDIPYHGHKVAVTWDVDGSHYGKVGLAIDVDDREAARQPTLGRILLPLPRIATPPINRPVDRAVQLVRGSFPKAQASTNTDAENLHEAIDGRVWFMPEQGNGWSSDNDAQQWFAIDMGKPVKLDRAELAFFADDGRFAAPSSYRVQIWAGGDWHDLIATGDAPVANGITNIKWPARFIQRIRFTFNLPKQRAMRLVEAKLF